MSESGKTLFDSTKNNINTFMILIIEEKAKKEYELIH